MSEPRPQLDAGGAGGARLAPRFDYGAGTPAPAQRVLVQRAAGKSSHFSLPVVAVLVLCAAIFLFLFQFNLGSLMAVWMHDPSWSHGFGIPVLAAVLCYMHWDRFHGVVVKRSLIGLAILVFGVLS